MPGSFRNFVYLVVGVLLFCYYYAYSQSYASLTRSNGGGNSLSDKPVPEEFEATTTATLTAVLLNDIESIQEDPISSPAEVPITSGTKTDNTDISEPKWYFQDDLPYTNPSFSTSTLQEYAPRNYHGPGGYTFATYYATRNATLQDPYFLAAQQLTYRLLWDPVSRSTKHPFTVFVAPFVPQQHRDLLLAAGALVRELPLTPPPAGHNPPTGFARWRDLFSKLHLWNQTDFRLMAFLDVDAFPTRNLDDIFSPSISPRQTCHPELLTRPEDLDYLTFSPSCEYTFAGVSPGLPTEINMGVVVLSPHAAMHARLLALARQPPADLYDTALAEQAFLNYAFRPSGPFPLSLMGREWNGFFPREEEMATLRVVHEKLWAVERTGMEELGFLRGLFGAKWEEMLEFYGSREFERLRMGSGGVV